MLCVRLCGVCMCVFVILLLAQYCGSLIHCLADGRNKREIKLQRTAPRDPSRAGSIAENLQAHQRLLLLLLVLKMLVDIFTGLRSMCERAQEEEKVFQWKQSTEEKGLRSWCYMMCLHFRCRLLLYWSPSPFVSQSYTKGSSASVETPRDTWLGDYLARPNKKSLCGKIRSTINVAP